MHPHYVYILIQVLSDPQPEVFVHIAVLQLLWVMFPQMEGMLKRSNGSVACYGILNTS